MSLRSRDRRRTVASPRPAWRRAATRRVDVLELVRDAPQSSRRGWRPRRPSRPQRGRVGSGSRSPTRRESWAASMSTSAARRAARAPVAERLLVDGQARGERDGAGGQGAHEQSRGRAAPRRRRTRARRRRRGARPRRGRRRTRSATRSRSSRAQRDRRGRPARGPHDGVPVPRPIGRAGAAHAGRAAAPGAPPPPMKAMRTVGRAGGARQARRLRAARRGSPPGSGARISSACRGEAGGARVEAAEEQARRPCARPVSRRAARRERGTSRRSARASGAAPRSRRSARTARGRGRSRAAVCSSSVLDGPGDVDGQGGAAATAPGHRQRPRRRRAPAEPHPPGQQRRRVTRGGTNRLRDSRTLACECAGATISDAVPARAQAPRSARDVDVDLVVRPPRGRA